MSEASVEGVGETTSSAATRALISRSALRDAATAALAAGGRIADLRGDAYGHGVLPVARAVIAAGAEAVLVDGDAEVAALGRAGLTAVSHGAADIDPRLLYGLPGAPLRPVLRLVGRVLSAKLLRAGDAVSYGYTYRAPSDRRVALVTGGYAQGIVRSLGNHAHVEMDGSLRPIVGRVAMDVCVIDLDDADALPGQEITYFGGTGPAVSQLAEWAQVTGMTAAELMTVAAGHAANGEED